MEITQLINTIEKYPNGTSFVGINGYINSKNEISNNLINIGASRLNALKKDRLYLNSIQYVDKLKEQARIEVLESIDNSIAVIEGTQPPNSRSQSQIDAYTKINDNVKIHNGTGIIHITGLRVSKKVIVKGDYKTVNSRPLTIEKNKIKAKLRSTKYVSFKLDNFDNIAIHGKRFYN